jgi:hypothetical protein
LAISRSRTIRVCCPGFLEIPVKSDIKVGYVLIAGAIMPH